MLRVMIAAALCAGAGAAHANSIEPFKPTTSARTSIVEVGCPSCEREAAKKAAEATEIKLAPGEQIVELRNVGGEMMIYRTENWLGGSPVTMVSKATPSDLAAHGVTPPEANEIADTAKPAEAMTEPPATAQIISEPPLFEPVIANTAPVIEAPVIDEDTKTSALGAAAQAPLDAAKFELRLN